MSSNRAVAIVLVAVLTAACAPASRPPTPLHALAPASWSCRDVIDGEGRRVDTAVTWHQASDPDDRDWRAAACATVGPVVIAPQARPPAGAALDELIVVTWNVYAGAGNLRALVEDLRRDLAPPPPIVLLLQEGYRTGRAVPASVPPDAAVPRAVRSTVPWRADILGLARALEMHLVYVPSVRNGRETGPDGPEDRGNAILSTLPLADVAVIELPRGRYRRVAVAATVSSAETPGRGWRLRMVSLHLDTVATWRRLFLFSSQLRARQARHVIDVMGDANPLVIGADLNTWAEGPAEPAVVRLLRALPDTPSPRWQPTFQGIWRLDYLFFRLPGGWQARSQRLNATFGSDHHPVSGRLTRVPSARIPAP